VPPTDLSPASWASLAVLLGGCASLSGLSGGGGGSADSAAHADTGEKSDAGASCTPEDGGVNDLRSKGCWSTFTLPATIDPNPSYLGAAFDGQFVYFASTVGNGVLRFDSSKGFTSDEAWSRFASDGLPGVAAGENLQGLVFDGRYLYGVPDGLSFSNGDLPPGFVRYDTTLPFLSSSSWDVFGGAPSSTLGGIYSGGTFDGRYVYFAPYETADADDLGVVMRYDTTGGFADGSSWTSFDTATLPTTASDFFGAVFDGRYVYLIPSPGSVVARYDTMASFAAAASWEVLDVSVLDSNQDGYSTGMFDGRFVYLIPAVGGSDTLRYDTQAPFTATSSWVGYPLNPDTSSYASGAFDGHGLYFFPGPATSAGPIFRCDEQATASAFRGGTAWTTEDPGTVHLGPVGSSVFDGRYVYVSPQDGFGGVGDGIFGRFEAVPEAAAAAQAKLPAYFGSFF
jgi:hypothetical protein